MCFVKTMHFYTIFFNVESHLEVLCVTHLYGCLVMEHRYYSTNNNLTIVKLKKAKKF